MLVRFVYKDTNNAQAVESYSFNCNTATLCYDPPDHINGCFWQARSLDFGFRRIYWSLVFPTAISIAFVYFLIKYHPSYLLRWNYTAETVGYFSKNLSLDILAREFSFKLTHLALDNNIVAARVEKETPLTRDLLVRDRTELATYFTSTTNISGKNGQTPRFQSFDYETGCNARASIPSC